MVAASQCECDDFFLFWSQLNAPPICLFLYNSYLLIHVEQQPLRSQPRAPTSLSRPTQNPSLLFNRTQESSHPNPRPISRACIGWYRNRTPRISLTLWRFPRKEGRCKAGPCFYAVGCRIGDIPGCSVASLIPSDGLFVNANRIAFFLPRSVEL